MSFPLILLTACLLDLLFGDPRWFPHPVRIIGRFAFTMENVARNLPWSERVIGGLTVVLVLLFTGGICTGLLAVLSWLPRSVFGVGAAFILYTTIAARDLLRHAWQVHAALAINLVTARRQVAMIVGRDTAQMDEVDIIRACVESVAENMSDGIIAPLFWATGAAALALPIGGIWPVACGVTVAMLYKAINTMDSMFGYKDEQYLHFGFSAARLDDLVNFFPARISGLAIIPAALFCRGNLKNSLYILLRDRRRHTSPNAGWPEAAMAGALGLQLGGDSYYSGKIVGKSALGEALMPPEPKHILLACRQVLAGTLICLPVFIGGFFCMRIVFS